MSFHWEQWNWNIGIHWEVENTFLNAMDQRLELELGLGKESSDCFLSQLWSVAYSPIDSFMVKDYSIGFSNEWKFKLSDPVANKLDQLCMLKLDLKEMKLNWKVNWYLTNRLEKIFLQPISLENMKLNTRRKMGEIETKETPVELDLAYMHIWLAKTCRSWVGGSIITMKSKKESGSIQHGFAGPTLHFSGDPLVH